MFCYSPFLLPVIIKTSLSEKIFQKDVKFVGLFDICIEGIAMRLLILRPAVPHSHSRQPQAGAKSCGRRELSIISDSCTCENALRQKARGRFVIVLLIETAVHTGKFRNG